MPNTNKLTKAQWMTLLAAFLGWMFDGFEMGLFPIIARPALQDLLASTDDKLFGIWNARITACFLFGAATGGLLFGWMGDKIGRIRSMALSILTYSLFTGLCYFAAAPWHLGVFRFISALGMGGEWALGVALVVECWPEKARPMLAGAIGAASNVGFLLIAAIGLTFTVSRESWRWMTLVGVAPAFLTFLIMLTVPESEKWKHAVAKKVSKPIREVFAPGMRKTTLLAIVLASIPLVVTWGAISAWLPPLADQLTGGKVPHAKSFTQIAVSIGAIIGCLIAPVVGGKVGRRPVYFGLCLLSLGVCAIQFRVLKEYNYVFLLVNVLAGSTTAAFYGWLPLYLPELFPTRMRATGQGLSFNFGRIIAGVGAIQMGTLVAFLGGDIAKAAATISLIYVVGLVLIWFSPETKGRPLPE